MFFQNIAQWSKKLMWSVTIICYALYIGIIVIAPAIVVAVKYDIFQKSEKLLNLTGLALIAFVIIGIAAYILIKKSIAKLPQASVPAQRFKFGLDTLFDCIPIGIALYAMFAIKDDMYLAFSTVKICIWLFFAGIIWNGLFIKFIDAEWSIRDAAKEDCEKEKRRGVV